MMESNIIVMLTHDDKTVQNAIDVFKPCQDMPVSFWGFKDVGIPRHEMRKLIQALKDAGKTTFLEIVSYTKGECMVGAEVAVDFGFDYLMGTLFFPEVWDYLKGKGIKYFPFVGGVSGSPSILDGTVASMLAEAEFLLSQGVDGVDLLAFRHRDNPEVLARDFISESKIPVVLAGSIDSYKRIEFVNQINPWAFTMGSALFNKNFLNGGDFRENLEQVIKKMEALNS
jgi:hypothetical protein